MVLIGFVDALAVALLMCILARFVAGRRRKHLPPGPSGWPLIGNVLGMPTSHEWQTFAKWGEKWGDVISITLLGQPVVILNSSHAAVDMLDKKSAIYSDRPTFPVCGQVIGYDRTLVLLHYGPVWRETRRLFSKTIGTRDSLMHLSDRLERGGHRFLTRLMAQPETLFQQVRGFTGASILSIAYGYNVEREDDELIRLVDKAVEEFSLASAPGAYFADALPILIRVPAWLPGAGWKRRALAWRRDLEAMCDLPFNHTKQQMKTGKASPSFVSMNLIPDTDSGREFLVKSAAASLYSAGADTTVSAICSFFLAMMCFPGAQKKAQAEIDRVVGNDRLPRLNDRDELHYVRALIWEVLRWQPIGPLGVPHRLTEDDTHAGYFLPKGTIVIANIWRMLRDPSRYPNPEVFNPDRFLPSNDAEPEYDPRHIVFGFGRRVCPGSQLAETSLFLICALSLAVFDIAKPIVDGNVVEPSLEYTTGTISHPVPFECSVKPRSAKASALVAAAMSDSVF
ncbi:cytochrome P450 [Fomitopsis serialis]|uniref:cytochrome P450 n=1 Tax=Fomitopsis serialis TaxID=139415 RepID=UPI002008D40F|nr:cytochrome P450 [Neoantrodia serialis]KAH9938483.1 cytochrome P450 [Neoantrodia serialis]